MLGEDVIIQDELYVNGARTKLRRVHYVTSSVIYCILLVHTLKHLKPATWAITITCT